MKIVVESWRGSQEVELPLENKHCEGIFDASGQQIMKYYDQTGREEWRVPAYALIESLQNKVIASTTGKLELYDYILQHDGLQIIAKQYDITTRELEQTFIEAVINLVEGKEQKL